MCAQLIGSLIDGHPQAIVANEFNVLGRPPRPSTTSNNSTPRGAAILGQLALNSAVCGVYGRTQAGFNYSLGGALWWQGRWCHPGAPPGWCVHGAPRIIGDKRGGGTSQILDRLGVNGAIARLVAFSREVSLPLRVLHVLRNPFDMAATQFFTHSSVGDWHHQAHSATTNESAPWHALRSCERAHLARTADFYGRLIARNAALRAQLRSLNHCACALDGFDVPQPSAGMRALAEDSPPVDTPPSLGVSARACLREQICTPPRAPAISWLDMSSEAMQQTPVHHLQLVCRYFSIECPEAFVSAAASVVRPSRHATSDLLQWPPTVVSSVTALLREASGSEPQLRPLLDSYARPPRHIAGGNSEGGASRIKLTRLTPSCQPTP
jgi:hypothetical protein